MQDVARFHSGGTASGSRGERDIGQAHQQSVRAHAGKAQVQVARQPVLHRTVYGIPGESRFEPGLETTAQRSEALRFALHFARSDGTGFTESHNSRYVQSSRTQPVFVSEI